MDIALFVNITSRAWSLPILSSLHKGVAGRQATLLAATSASRTAFTQSLDHLIGMGLLERNPGYGHPLRPEFRLTQLGISAAAIANKIQNVSSDEDQDLLRRSWTLPVLTLLHRPSHFNEIKRGFSLMARQAKAEVLPVYMDGLWGSIMSFERGKFFKK